VAHRAPRILVFHPALASYRVDLFNALARGAQTRIVFLSDELPYDARGNESIDSNDLRCDHGVLRDAWVARGRIIPIGLRHELAAFAPDVVVTHEFSLASAWMALQGSSRRPAWVVWTALSPMQIASLRGPRLQIARMLAHRADSLLTYSLEAASALSSAARVSLQKIFTCANHQSRERLREVIKRVLPDVVHECRLLGLQHRRIVVVVGRLVPTKNIAVTIRAFAAAFPHDDRTALVVIGEGPERANLLAEASRLGIGSRVHFLGHRHHDHVLGWLAVSSLHVLASTVEPFGAVVGEGLVAGTPALVSRAAGAAHLAIPEGNGGVFDPTDEPQLASLIRSFEPRMRDVNDLAHSPRSSLTAPSVEDDASGFLAACHSAIATRAEHD
jgi:glycosyltransferase involved in cell wall biosynthesis